MAGHPSLEKMTSTTVMLPKENGNEKMVILTPRNGVGKILIREDTILANIHGCAGCGRSQFTCSGVKSQWSALCWGKQSEKKYVCLVVLLAVTFVLSIVGTIVFSATNTISDAILSKMVLKNNSMAFNLWQYPTVQPFMKVTIFNYTNWMDVKHGLEEKLKVEAVGPYVYSQQVERVNIEFDGDKLSFQEKNSYTFLPEQSTGAQFDEIHVPNLPLLGLVSKAIEMGFSPLAHYSLSSVLTWNDHPEAFLKLPVHSFLWGYDDNIIKAAKPFLSLTGQYQFERFGLLVMKNGTLPDRITINTGDHDISKMNVIEQVNGKEYLSFWGSKECNSVQASDGTIFPPSILDRKTTLYVFFPNLCRRIPFVYEKDVETEDGVHLLRYRMPKNVFDNPALNPSNECYCNVDAGVCPLRGIVNVTECAKAPALVSFPHFYLGDKKLTEDIIDLVPRATQLSYVDIHPTLGISLSGNSSLQINIQVKKNIAFSSLNFLDDGLILPTAYIEVTIGELPESLRSLIYHGTYSTAAAQLALIWVSVVGLVVSGACLSVIFMRRKRKPCATLRKITAEVELTNQSVDSEVK